MSLILSGTDGLSDVDGTAATPAIRGTDTNTGIFFPAADTVAASVGGTEGLRLTTTGLTTQQDATVYGVRVGRGAGAVSTNTAVGASALGANTSGIQNTGLGANALQYQTNNNNTALGYNAMVGVNGSSNGGSNTAVGSNSLAGLTGGNFNTAIGQQSLLSNTTASNNTAVGYQAGYSNTTGTRHTMLGTQAGYSTNGGDPSNGALVAVGYQAGYTYAVTGVGSEFYGTTIIGSYAGYSVNSANNTALGGFALYSAAGANNTAIGAGALFNNTGTFNTAIGRGAGAAITSGTKNTILGAYNGNQGGLDIRTASNNIVLSDGDGNPRMFINGTAQNRQVNDGQIRYGEQTFTWGNVSSISQNIESLFPNLPTSVNSCFLIQVVTGQSAAVSGGAFIVAHKTGTNTWNFNTTNLGGVTTTPSGSGTTLTLSFSLGGLYGYAMVRALVVT